MLVQGKLLSNQDDLSDVFDIRRKVFIDEMGLSESEVFHDFDINALHVIIYEGEKMKPVATGSILYDGTTCYINNVAVLKDFRGRGYGDFTMRMLIGKALQSGIKCIYLKTYLNYIDFFKIFGFQENKNNSNVNGMHEMVLHEEWYITGCNKK